MTRALLDSHTHVWDLKRNPQDWITPNLAVINRDFTVNDLTDAIGAVSAAEVVGAVLVQASNRADETDDLLAASGAVTVRGIVGWIDLASPAVGAELDRITATEHGATLVGIRHLAHVAEPGWLSLPEVSRGLGELAARSMTFDLVVRAHQLSEARALVRRHENVRFVLDHLGNPPTDALDDWADDLRALAECPNVVAKVSGVAVKAPPGERLDGIRPALDVALYAFGPTRLMFGSDWPLVRLADGYDAWVGNYLSWSSILSDTEQAALDRETAINTYGLT